MNYFERGFLKRAQEQMPGMPIEEEKESETVVTCVSDCSYSQNPEKRCMLKSVTFSMAKPGEFACGQYAPMQQEVQDVRNPGNQTGR